jgi:signal transduction histidine kinase
MVLFTDIITYLNRKPKSYLIALGIILLILIGIIHYIEAVMTKGELSFSIFYLLPILLVSWYVNLRAGIIMSFVCAVVWEAIDFMTGPVYSHPLIPYWNTAVRLGFFLIVAIMLSRLKIVTSKLTLNIEQLNREINERVKTQEALNKQKDKFFSLLVHDLKGPLIPILGFTKRLIDGKVKSEKDTLRNLKTIQGSAGELLKTIEKTSNVLKEKRTDQAFIPEEVNVRDMLLSVVKSYLPEIESKGIDILINNKSKEGWNGLDKVIVTADPFQIETLMQNLLLNAIKYADTTIKVELNKNGSEIRFVISDDGPGIPEKYHENIFEEYFQVPGSKKGTGIGLYSVKKTVDNHKGEVIVNSSSGEGARFIVTVPL